jgi:hypothetical protein
MPSLSPQGTLAAWEISAEQPKGKAKKCLFVLGTVIVYSESPCSKIEGQPKGAGHCFFAHRNPDWELKEKCGTGANDLAANSSNFVGTASPTGMESGLRTEAVSAASTQAGNGTPNGSVPAAISSGTSMRSATSQSLQTFPTSSAASVCGSGRFVEVMIKVFMVMGNVEVFWV